MGMRALLTRVADLQREALDLRQRIRELEALADSDPLLGVVNRRAFLRELDRMLAYARRHGGPLSVVYFDMDRFKSINDAYGHAAGDAALAHVVAQFTPRIRASDLLGRLGGDEFALAMPHARALQAVARAEVLCAALSQTPVRLDGAQVTVRASFGVYEANPHDSAEDALAHADAAMLGVKRGKGVLGDFNASV